MKLTLKQTKRVMQLLNSIERESIEHFKERDMIVAKLENVKEIKEYKENFAIKAKEVVDWYNESLRTPFNTMKEELNRLNEMEKITRGNREKNKIEDKKKDLITKYNADVTEIKREWDVKLKGVEDEVLASFGDKEVVDIELPQWFTISSEDYEMFFVIKN